MEWSDEIDAKLFELWDKGLGSKKIGEILGTTDNSVIGRRSRLLKAKATGVPVKKPYRKPKPPIIDVHPAFDPKDNTWFFDGVEAKSIQDLIKKLPKGSTIKDYKKIA